MTVTSGIKNNFLEMTTTIEYIDELYPKKRKAVVNIMF